MKKLLALLVVLGLASSTFGAMSLVGFDATTLDPLGPIPDVLPSTVIIVGFVADVPVDALGIRMIMDEGTPMGTASNPGIHPNLTVNPVDGTDYVVNSGNVLIARSDGVALGGSKNPFGGVAVPAGERVAWFTYHVPALPASTIITIHIPVTSPLSIWKPAGGVNQSEFVPLTLHVIPEPMTLALLGLGGLGLLRRRR